MYYLKDIKEVKITREGEGKTTASASAPGAEGVNPLTSLKELIF